MHVAITDVDIVHQNGGHDVEVITYQSSVIMDSHMGHTDSLNNWTDCAI